MVSLNGVGDHIPDNVPVAVECYFEAYEEMAKR